MSELEIEEVRGPHTLAYAAIEPIKRDERSDLGLNVTYYTTTVAMQMIDISFINCLVGRVRVDFWTKQYAIIDRSTAVDANKYLEGED
jgi:hypothetical protein